MVTLDGIGGLFLQGPPPLIEHMVGAVFLSVRGGAIQYHNLPDDAEMSEFVFQGIQPLDDRISFGHGYYKDTTDDFYATCLTYVASDISQYREGPGALLTETSGSPAPLPVLTISHDPKGDENPGRLKMVNIGRNTVYGLLTVTSTRKRS